MKTDKTKLNTNLNLLDSIEFKTTLRFEASYSIKLKGGSAPVASHQIQKTRLVLQNNLLTSGELNQLIHPLFISKN